MLSQNWEDLTISNKTITVSDSAGFEYVKVYEVLEGLARQKLDNSTYFGADSTIALLIPKIPPNEAQKSYLLQRRDLIRKTSPGKFY